MKNPQQELEEATQEAVQPMTDLLLRLAEIFKEVKNERVSADEVEIMAADGDNPLPNCIQIKLGDEVLYEEDSHGAFVNTLTLGDVGYLADALQCSPGDLVREGDEPSFRFMVGDRQVLGIEQGVVTVNEIMIEVQKEDTLQKFRD